MHPAIGQLSSGRCYAYLDGYDAEPVFRDNADELEQLLGGRYGEETQTAHPGQAAPVAIRRSRARTLRDYQVTVRLKYPSIEHAGCELTITAYNQKNAISEARRQVREQSLYDRHDGPLIYSAQLAPD